MTYTLDEVSVAAEMETNPIKKGMLRAYAASLREREASHQALFTGTLAGTPVGLHGTRESIEALERFVGARESTTVTAGQSVDRKGVTDALAGQLHDEIMRHFADQLEAFQPRCEIGPLHGAGMAFAYKDVAKTIREMIATTAPTLKESGHE